MPAPPARMRSARVPCRQNSTASSPARNCRSNSAFSPTYDETILRICLVWRRSPSPQSSTPALFETQVRFLTPFLTRALMRFSGIPHSPNPPTTSNAPSKMSLTASSAEATTLLIMAGGRLSADHGAKQAQDRFCGSHRRGREAAGERESGRIGHAIAEIQTGGMTALAEARVRFDRSLPVKSGERYDLNSCLFKEAQQDSCSIPVSQNPFAFFLRQAAAQQFSWNVRPDLFFQIVEGLGHPLRSGQTERKALPPLLQGA